MLDKERMKDFLDNFCDGNMVFYFDETEEALMNNCIDMIREDHGFYDIILKNEDLLQILSITSTEYNEQECILNNLCRLLIDKIGVEHENFDSDLLNLWMSLKIRGKKTPKGRVRIHVVLDDITDERIQIAINDLIITPWVTVMCYTTKKILTRATSSGEEIEAGDAYQVIQTSLRHNKIEERLRGEK